jgi:PKD repeat protein
MRAINRCFAGLVVTLVIACGQDGGTGPAPKPNVAPSADFSGACLYLRCEFTDASSDSDGSIVRWSWDFGDGQASSERNPVHEYAQPGQYAVTLTATDDSSANSSRSRNMTAAQKVTTSLTCADAAGPGGFVACTLRLEEPAGFKVLLDSHSCVAHGNVFRVTAPAIDTLTVDGCYAAGGSELALPGPFPAGTEIAAEVTAPLLSKAPALRVSGQYPEWTLNYEDGGDADFDDMVMTVTALPVP